MSGFPQRSTIFFPGKRLEPPRAITIAIMSISDVVIICRQEVLILGKKVALSVGPSADFFIHVLKIYNYLFIDLIAAIVEQHACDLYNCIFSP